MKNSSRSVLRSAAAVRNITSSDKKSQVEDEKTGEIYPLRSLLNFVQ